MWRVSARVKGKKGSLSLPVEEFQEKPTPSEISAIRSAAIKFYYDSYRGHNPTVDIKIEPPNIDAQGMPV
jgi:hypothetical protein